MTTPIPVPRLRTNVPSFSNASSPREAHPGQHYQSNPRRFPDPYTRATPPYDPASVYIPSNLPTGSVPSPASSAHTPLASHATASGPQALPTPNCIRVRDLAHVQQLAGDSLLQPGATARRRSAGGPDDISVRYEISAMPVSDIIEMVAGLLTKITTTNDRQHEHLHEHIPPPDGTAGLSPQASSVLAFHGKNVPTITVLSYLTRIHRYCPTTYEVFLGLLVYFDRMTERVNSGSLQSLRQASRARHSRDVHDSMDGAADSTASSGVRAGVSGVASGRQSTAATPPLSASSGVRDRSSIALSPITPELSFDADPLTLSQFFVVDSYNIHRLVIAGVTCASKFFSDVFYTNSRYAKVLPPFSRSRFTHTTSAAQMCSRLVGCLWWSSIILRFSS